MLQGVFGSATSSSSSSPSLGGHNNSISNSTHHHHHNNTSNNENNSSAFDINSSSSSGGNDQHAADMITSLRSKMEKQRAELDVRTDNVNAIQRNFQRLSEMYAADRQRLQDMERNAKLMAGELESLRAEQKLFRAVQAEYALLKKHALDAEVEHGRVVAAMQAEIGSVKEQADLRSERILSLQEQLRKQQQAVERDGTQKERLCAALLGCDKALAETMTMVVDAERTLKSEIRTMHMISTATTSGSSASASSSFSGSTGNRQQGYNNNNRQGDAKSALDDEQLMMLATQQLQLVSIKEPSSAALSKETSEHSFTFALEQQSHHADTVKGGENSSSSSVDLDARLRSHNAALKSFSFTLSQKLGAATRLLCNGKQQQDAALKDHADLVGDMALQLRRMMDELKATEMAAGANRNLAGDLAKQAAEERRILQGELQRLRREAWENSVKLLLESEEAERHRLSSDAQLTTLDSGVGWMQKLRWMSAAEQAARFEKEMVEVERRWGKDREELGGLQRMMQRQMGDAQSKNSMVEAQINDLKQQVAALKGEQQKADGALSETESSLRVRTRDLLLEQEDSKRAALAASAFFTASITLSPFLTGKIHATALTQLRAAMDKISFELSAERRQHGDTQRELAVANAQLGELRRSGSENESALQRASRDKDREMQTLKRDAGELKSQVDAARAKAAALQENVTALSDQLRLAREAEARTRALHAQAVSDADRARQEAALQQGTADDLRHQLTELKQRLDLLSRKADASDSVVADYKRQLAQALAAKEKEVAVRAQNEEKIVELQDWAGQLRALHAQSITTVKKILAAEKACESGYSCQSCLEVMKDPLVLAPCGHNFCRNCFHEANQSAKARSQRQQGQLAGDTRSYCPECRSGSVTCAVPSVSLDLLSGKFAFRVKALEELSKVLERSSTFQSS